MKYKMVCIDMDGTFLDDKKEVSTRNIEAVKRAAAMGVKIVVCTGRLYTSAKFYSELMGVKSPVIASNGAYIREKDEDRVIYKAPLLYENSMKILNVLRKYSIYPHFNSVEEVYYEKKIHSSKIYSDANKDLPEERKVKLVQVSDWEKLLKEEEDNILKCIAMDDDLEKIKKAREEIEAFSELTVVSSWYNNFEVMIKGVSKGAAASILAEFYNIKSEEVMCIGDNENDLSMIKYAGLGIAMGNAEEKVKKEASFVTDVNNESGVAKAIEKFILD